MPHIDPETLEVVKIMLSFLACLLGLVAAATTFVIIHDFKSGYRATNSRTPHHQEITEDLSYIDDALALFDQDTRPRR